MGLKSLITILSAFGYVIRLLWIDLAKPELLKDFREMSIAITMAQGVFSQESLTYIQEHVRSMSFASNASSTHRLLASSVMTSMISYYQWVLCEGHWKKTESIGFRWYVSLPFKRWLTFRHSPRAEPGRDGDKQQFENRYTGFASSDTGQRNSWLLGIFCWVEWSMAQVRFKKRIFASAGMRLPSGEVRDHRFISLSDTDFATENYVWC